MATPSAARPLPGNQPDRSRPRLPHLLRSATVGIDYQLFGPLPRLPRHVDAGGLLQPGDAHLRHRFTRSREFRPLEPVEALVYAHWEGVLTFAKDIFNMPVTVETAVLDPDGRSARVRVAW